MAIISISKNSAEKIKEAKSRKDLRGVLSPSILIFGLYQYKTKSGFVGFCIAEKEDDIKKFNLDSNVVVTSLVVSGEKFNVK